MFPHLFPMKWWEQMPWSSFSECWALRQLFHSPLSLSSRGFWVPLHFLPRGWCHLHIWGYWYRSALIPMLLEGQASCLICDWKPAPSAARVGSPVTVMTSTSKSIFCPLELWLPLFLLTTTKLFYHDRLLPFPRPLFFFSFLRLRASLLVPKLGWLTERKRNDS